MRKAVIKAVSMICAALMLFSVFLIPASAVVAPYVNPADDTYVVNDLKKMGYNPADFPTDPSADFVQVIHFLEYGYDAGGKQNFYSLYLYLYNPSGKAIDIEGSYLELSYYDANAQGLSRVAKYPVTVEGRSIDEFDENVFYKLKVVGVQSIVKDLSTVRREYRLSGIEIKYKDETEIKNYPLDTSWVYTGYQYNFGSDNPDGSLWYRVEEFETIDVEVIPLTWFSDTSNLGEDYRWEVKSYAFNIPLRYILKYGDILHNDPENAKYQTSGLWSVSGEYYKYAVNGLIVPDQTWYDRFDKARDFYLGTPISDFPSFRHGGGSLISGHTYEFPFSYNWRHQDIGIKTSSLSLLRIFMLLSQGNSPYISHEDFKDLWSSQGEPKFYDTSNIPMIGSHAYNVGEKIEYDISVDGADLSSALITHAQGVNAAGTSTFNKWLDKLFNKGLYTDETGYVDCKPIVELNAVDISVLKTNDAIGKALYISNDNVSEVRDFYNDYGAMGLNKVYIVRTGVEPYYESDVTLYENPGQIIDGVGGYYYEKVIHTDFDILSFTFRNEKGAKVTVPVNCKPVDNLGAVVGGNNQDDNNPNKYPESPSGLGGIWGVGKQLIDFIAKFLEWLDQFKTVFLLIVAGVGTAVIFALVCIFWKWLQPIFQRIGEVLGPVAKGAGKFFGGIFKALGFIGKLLLNMLKAIWNIGMTILFFFTGLDLRIKGGFDLSTGNTIPHDVDTKRERAYGEAEERRKEAEESRRADEHKSRMLREDNEQKFKILDYVFKSKDEQRKADAFAAEQKRADEREKREAARYKEEAKAKKEAKEREAAKEKEREALRAQVKADKSEQRRKRESGETADEFFKLAQKETKNEKE